MYILNEQGIVYNLKLHSKMVTVQYPHLTFPPPPFPLSEGDRGGNVFPRPWWEGLREGVN